VPLDLLQKKLHGSNNEQRLLQRHNLRTTETVLSDCVQDELRFLASMGPVQKNLYDSNVKQRLLQGYIQVTSPRNQ
jgi:hypothetical protein